VKQEKSQNKSLKNKQITIAKYQQKLALMLKIYLIELLTIFSFLKTKKKKKQHLKMQPKPQAQILRLHLLHQKIVRILNLDQLALLVKINLEDAVKCE
jgi:hypothetical protein